MHISKSEDEIESPTPSPSDLYAVKDSDGRSSIVSAQPSPSESTQPKNPSSKDEPATFTQSSPSRPELLSPNHLNLNQPIE